MAEPLDTQLAMLVTRCAVQLLRPPHPKFNVILVQLILRSIPTRFWYVQYLT